MNYKVYSLFWGIVDLVFPPTYGGCGTSGVRWWNNCQERAPKNLPSIYNLWSRTIQTNGLYKRYISSPAHFEAARSFAELGNPIRKVRSDIKNRRDIGWILPIPLGDGKAKQRGCNPAAHIAKLLASYLQFPNNPLILGGSRETIIQVEISLAEPQNNCEEIFQTSRQDVHRMGIIIDDGMTIGTTLNAFPKTLIENGARAVFGLTIARAVLNSCS